jgi:hypothetical protein
MRSFRGLPRRILLASLILAAVAVIDQATLVLKWIMGGERDRHLRLDLGDDWRSIGRLLWQSIGPILLGALIGALEETCATLRSAVQASQAAALAKGQAPDPPSPVLVE